MITPIVSDAYALMTEDLVQELNQEKKLIIIAVIRFCLYDIVLSLAFL